MFIARAAFRVAGFLVVSLTVAVNAQTIWYVNAASPCPGSGTQAAPFCTIQAAINAAAANATPPDEIIVADGLYTGAGNKDLDFGGKRITLRSASDDPTRCIIDCQGSGRGLYFHSGETAGTVVQGVGISNGRVTGNSPGGARGGGVYCNYTSPTITNCTTTGSTAYAGGGLCCSSFASPTLTNCSFNGNTAMVSVADSFGGGIYCYDHSSPILISCTIRGNASAGYYYAHGGGLCCGTYSNPTLRDCTIGENTAIGGGRSPATVAACPACSTPHPSWRTR